MVSTPNTINFLHYSGHGGQEPDRNRTTGYDDTICPVDFESAGQINSTTLHQQLVSALAPGSSLFIVLDCCHSGSAVELPYVYRTDDEGKVSVMNNVKAGMNLVMEADGLLNGAYGMNSVAAAKQLLGDANNFFQGFKHHHHGPDGLEADTSGRDWSREGKFVTMYSGCRDEETSAVRLACVVVAVVANGSVVGCVHLWEELWSHDLGLLGDYEEEPGSYLHYDFAGYKDQLAKQSICSGTTAVDWRADGFESAAEIVMGEKIAGITR